MLQTNPGKLRIGWLASAGTVAKAYMSKTSQGLSYDN